MRYVVLSIKEGGLGESLAEDVRELVNYEMAGVVGAVEVAEVDLQAGLNIEQLDAVGEPRRVR